jgi:hypothetical protein
VHGRAQQIIARRDKVYLAVGTVARPLFFLSTFGSMPLIRQPEGSPSFGGDTAKGLGWISERLIIGSCNAETRSDRPIPPIASDTLQGRTLSCRRGTLHRQTPPPGTANRP